MNMLKHDVKGKMIHFISFDNKTNELSFVDYSNRSYTYMGFSFDTFEKLTNYSTHEIEETFRNYKYSGIIARIEYLY